MKPVKCLTCKGEIRWISCPTGGWWAHCIHPEDGHDAVGMHGWSAGVLVQILPVGQPGLVALCVESVGPEPLDRDEMVRTLRAAADQLEAG